MRGFMWIHDDLEGQGGHIDETYIIRPSQPSSGGVSLEDLPVKQSPTLQSSTSTFGALKPSSLSPLVLFLCAYS